MDIASMLEVEVQEVADSKENVTPSLKKPATYASKNFSNEENDFYKLTYGSDIASVRFLRLHCTACDEHIGSAPAEAHNMHEHPILRVLLCAKCREFYGDGTFEQGDDAKDMFCRWCANGGILYCCSYCSNTFCSKCMKRNFDPPTIKRIEAEDIWQCFVCDPKDLYPLRSITRALIAHIETVTRILENNKRMSPKEIEEKMHLDETKCCSRKRKRRKRRTYSDSNDDEEDVDYDPEMDRAESPPTKKRKGRCVTMRNAISNGCMDHDSYASKRRPKSEFDIDPDDLMNQCEQTMIEGDTEILNSGDETNGVTDSEDNNSNLQQQQQQQEQPAQKAQVIQPKIHVNNSMGIEPRPLTNFLKVGLNSSGKKFKVVQHRPSKLVVVPISTIPKVVPASSISFVKPTTHFLVPKNVAKTLTTQSLQSTQLSQQPPPLMPVQAVSLSSLQSQPKLQPQSQLQPQQQQQSQQKQQPSVIDLDSDDEAVIVENVVTPKSTKAFSARYPKNLTNEVTLIEDHTPANSVTNINERSEQVISGSQTDLPAQATVSTMPITRTKSTEQQSLPVMQVDKAALLVQKRYQRFEKMLRLQSQEIDTAVSELKTKILKLVQTSMVRTTKQPEEELQNAAFLCTKRFHRALRKALVELSHVNDRLVRDYVHWKKKSIKAPIITEDQSVGTDSEVESVKEKKITRKSQASTDNNLTVEMICERESASEDEEADDDDDDVNEDMARVNETREMEASEIPVDFSTLLDHLTIFKRKPTAVKAVGEGSLLTHEKACQAYDVPFRDYEKCIGYSLLTKAEYDPETKEEILRPVVQPDENFGKYQEQYLFYLQHIEDCGIETDDYKGLPDPNHIPLKDLIDSSSPFIMDMLERLSPVTLSNGCTSPTHSQSEAEPLTTAVDVSSSNTAPDAASDGSKADASSSAVAINNSEAENTTSQASPVEQQQTTEEDKSSEDNVAATSRAVEELVKMVTKLSEDLRNEKQQASDAEKKNCEEEGELATMEIEKETVSTVNSILREETNVNQDQSMDVECSIID